MSHKATDQFSGKKDGVYRMLTPGTGVAAGTAVAMVGAGATVVSGGTAAVAGVPVAAIGVETAILGEKTATVGVILMANSAQNKSGGYERGNTSSGNKSPEITFAQGNSSNQHQITVKVPNGYKKD